MRSPDHAKVLGPEPGLQLLIHLVRHVEQESVVHETKVGGKLRGWSMIMVSGPLARAVQDLAVMAIMVASVAGAIGTAS